MLGSGVAVFGDAKDYERELREFGCSGFFPFVGEGFCARMVRLALHRIVLLRLDESLGRVAAWRCAPGWRRFVLTPATGRIFVGGIEVTDGTLVTYGAGPVVQERTEGPCDSRILLVPEDFLAALTRALTGAPRGLDAGVRRWRSPTEVIEGLNALHAAAMRTTATRLLQVHGAEAYRGLEQEMVRILVHCLSAGQVSGHSEKIDQRAEIVSRFEAILSVPRSSRLSLDSICGILNTSMPLLKASCLEHVGTTPGHFRRLVRKRQLALADTWESRDRP